MSAAYRNSLVGLRDIWRGEEAFRIEAVFCLLSVPVALWIGETFFQSATLIAAGLLLVIDKIV